MSQRLIMNRWPCSETPPSFSMVELTNTNMRMIKVVREACQMVPELAIPEEAKADEHVYKLAIGVCDARIELAKVQLELNL